MLIARFAAATLAALLAAGPAFTQEADATKPVGIRSITPTSVTAGDGPTNLTIDGWGFKPGALVRIRAAGSKGAGTDHQAALDSPARLRLVLPADLTQKPGRLELRVKNPDVTSDWTVLEIVAASTRPVAPSAAGPRIEYISPSEVTTGAHNLRVTVRGTGLVDGSTVILRSGNATREVRGTLVNGMLVFTLPDDQAAEPRVILVQVRTPAGLVSESARLTIARGPATGGATGDPETPFVVAVDPARIDPRSGPEIPIELRAQNVSSSYFVVMRREGASSEGSRVPLGPRNDAPNGTFLTVLLLPRMVPEAGYYELQVVNANGRRSNWARLEVTGTAPAQGGLPVTVTVAIPPSVTMTAAALGIPVEISARNTGRTAVRLTNFTAVDPNGAPIQVEGTVEVPAGAERTARLLVPLPATIALGERQGTELQLALTWSVTGATNARTPAPTGRFPESGFAKVAVRNEVGLVAIGREYVRPDAAGGPEGWRFFKASNDANRGEGEAADFYLFDAPAAAAAATPAEELYNFRPDEGDPSRRNIFFLAVRGSEITAADLKNRELGTRLGYVRSAPAAGLVPLYRWVRREGQRAANHFLTIENDRAKLPARLGQGGWTLEERPVGFVVARR